MSSLNKVMLIGRLGADPDVRRTEQGVKFARFSLATAMGGAEQKADWHSVVVFGKQADACEAYLSKGQACYVEGRLSYYKQERGDQTRYHTDIVANQVRFLSPPRRTERGAEGVGAEAEEGRALVVGSRGEEELMEAAIPF
jgi:single-strand DNA-binding protein